MNDNAQHEQPAPPALADRRPLKTRQARWARALATRLAGAGVTPNTISIASVFFALTAMVLVISSQRLHPWPLRSVALLAAAGAIQLRLLCNLLDGMVAVEGGRRSATGDLFNEVPDRIADVLILAGAGYAIMAGQAPGHWSALPHPAALGWLASVMALMTAYVRALGRSLGTPSFFHGPMAKPHRMAAMTIALALSAILAPWRCEPPVIYAALAIIVAGAAVTAVRRLRLIAARLCDSNP